MTGRHLFDILIRLSGLPADPAQKELERLLKEATLNPDSVSLEQLREVLAGYLQDVLCEAKASTTDAPR